MKEAAVPAGRERTAYFDHLKVFEYFMLMIVHTASYQWYAADINSVQWLVLNFYKSATRPCVLVFFIISGALMLGKDIEIGKLYRKHVLKLAVCFIIWNIIYAVITYWNDGISGMVFKFFNSNYHLWYLLAMIGIYICFPLIRLIAENKKTMKYFMILSFVFAFFLPTLFNILTGFGSPALVHYTDMIFSHFYDMHMEVVLGYPFFFIGGYYIHEYGLDKIFRRILYALGTLSIIAGPLVNALYVRRIGFPDDTFSNSFMLYEMFIAFAVFTFFKYNVKGNASLNRISRKISSWGLGIYMVHDLVILGINRFLGLNATVFNPIFAVPVVALIALIICTAISAVLNLIPGVNKYLV